MSRANRAATLERPSNDADGLKREQLVGFQRARIVSAMLEVVLEVGASSVTVTDVVSRSGVSRRTFYEVFSDREECFLAALEEAIERIAAVVVPAYAGEGSSRGASWRERVRAALGELLGLLDEDPSLGQIVVVESLVAGPRALERRGEVFASLVAAVEQGRLAPGASEPPPLTAEGLVGGVAAILHTRLQRPSEPLTALTSPLTAMIVLPYLGKAAAAKELDRPAPALRPPRSGASPLRDLGIRMTYRTLRVLDAVATNPGASNRTLGDAAGIGDQGQISKLLRRLERLQLIENTIPVQGKGAPNAWRLTERGTAAQQAVHALKAGPER